MILNVGTQLPPARPRGECPRLSQVTLKWHYVSLQSTRHPKNPWSKKVTLSNKKVSLPRNVTFAQLPPACRYGVFSVVGLGIGTKLGVYCFAGGHAMNPKSAKSAMSHKSAMNHQNPKSSMSPKSAMSAKTQGRGREGKGRGGEGGRGRGRGRPKQARGHSQGNVY